MRSGVVVVAARPGSARRGWRARCSSGRGPRAPARRRARRSSSAVPRRTRCGPSCCATSPTTSPPPSRRDLARRPRRHRAVIAGRLGRTSVAPGARAAPEHADRGCWRRRWTPSSTPARTGRSSCCSTTRTWPTRRASSSSPTCCGASAASGSSPSSPAARRRSGPTSTRCCAPTRPWWGAARARRPAAAARRRRAARGIRGELPPEQRAQVIAAADGNPLLAIEGARAAGAGRDGPPESLQAVVRAAVGRLPDGARRAAELAAVAGRDLTLTEVGALASQEDVLRALDCGLLTAERGDFGYRHALLRDAALADMPEPRRRGLHEELAARPARPCRRDRAPPAARGPRRPRRGAPRRAARDAAAVGAVDEAAEFLREALELRPGDPSLTVELAAAEAYGGRRLAAEDALRTTLDLLAPSEHAERGAVHARAARWYSARSAVRRRRCRRRARRSPSWTAPTPSIPPSCQRPGARRLGRRGDGPRAGRRCAARSARDGRRHRPRRRL